MRLLALLVCLLLLASIRLLQAGADWTTALRNMPLQLGNTALDRTNCVERILKSFQPNSAVKGIVFLPGATDELYLLRRVEPRLISPAPSLWESIHSLTNGGFIRATFRPPFLLLHTDSDLLKPMVAEEPGLVLPPAKGEGAVPKLLCIDRNWEKLQPDLEHWLGVSVGPSGSNRKSWHFYRHNLTGFQLSRHELLEAVCLSGKTRASIDKHGGLLRNRIQIVFSPDTRLAEIRASAL